MTAGYTLYVERYDTFKRYEKLHKCGHQACTGKPSNDSKVDNDCAKVSDHSTDHNCGSIAYLLHFN